MRLPKLAPWMAPVVLAIWGVLQIVGGQTQTESLDVVYPVSAADPPPAEVSTQEHTPAVAAPVVPPLSRSTPTHILIKSVWINAHIDTIGLARNGVVETPAYATAKNASWYRLGPTPGELGAAVLLGHVDTDKERAVFFELRRIKPGAIIEISRADRSKVRFKVDSIEQFHKSEFPTARVYSMQPNPVLRMVTCGGKFNPKTKQYEDNIIAFATMVV